ncbi:group I intron endonuclease [Flavobacterium fontis]|uniref:Group I intron endonuclease n=2 Tax=Flavobacterium fontis TaxID=1124188 RepID=A0A1M4WAT0_9FLAO|nr:group I intron endonuclease [Flavobacterium fontis]
MSNYIVYLVENTFTSEVYIGATTKTLVERKIDHLTKTKNGSNVCFHQAIQSYGPESFVWSVIDTADSIDELAQKETKYIINYNSVENGYNSDCGGGFKKKVYQFNIETGKLINSYEDLISAANAVNATKTSISNACLLYNKTCKGFLWSYSSTFELSSTLDLRKKTVNQISLDGNFIACYDSASEASRKTGISKSCITRCCREEREHSGGFLWKYT